jgi:Tfp pilus assembly protein PilN
MILINLLPPEMMKRQAGFDPMMLIWVAAALLIACSGGLWYYVHVKLIPASNDIYNEYQDTLTKKTAEAQQVTDLQDKIADFEKQKDTLVGLVNKKVYWAHTLDDFCTLLDGDHGDYTVRCTRIEIVPGGKSTPDTVSYNVNANLQVVGNEDDMAGDYIKSLFHAIGKSEFWKHEFVGKPEDSYNSDLKHWEPQLKRVWMSFRLTFQRIKTLPKPKPAPDAAQG